MAHRKCRVQLLADLEACKYGPLAAAPMRLCDVHATLPVGGPMKNVFDTRQAAGLGRITKGTVMLGSDAERKQNKAE